MSNSLLNVYWWYCIVQHHEEVLVWIIRTTEVRESSAQLSVLHKNDLNQKRKRTRFLRSKLLRSRGKIKNKKVNVSEMLLITWKKNRKKSGHNLTAITPTPALRIKSRANFEQLKFDSARKITWYRILF